MLDEPDYNLGIWKVIYAYAFFLGVYKYSHQFIKFSVSITDYIVRTECGKTSSVDTRIVFGLRVRKIL